MTAGLGFGVGIGVGVVGDLGGWRPSVGTSARPRTYTAFCGVSP